MRSRSAVERWRSSAGEGEAGGTIAVNGQPIRSSASSIAILICFLLSRFCVSFNSSYGFKQRIRGEEGTEERGREEQEEEGGEEEEH